MTQIAKHVTAALVAVLVTTTALVTIVAVPVAPAQARAVPSTLA
jgi:hypothetical protein